MASIQDSEEVNTWFANYGQHVFDNWNTDAQCAQMPVWCQSVRPADVRRPLTAHAFLGNERIGSPLHAPRTQPPSSVVRLDLSDEIAASKSSSKNTLTASNLDALEANVNMQFMTGITTPYLPESTTYLDSLKDAFLGDTHLVGKVRQWLKTIPKPTERRSSQMSPLTAGERPDSTILRAIHAYGAEKEGAVTKHEHHRRQQNPGRDNARETALRMMALSEIVRNKSPIGQIRKDIAEVPSWGNLDKIKKTLPYISHPREYPSDCLSKTKKWVNPHLEQSSQDGELVDLHYKARKSVNENKGKRKRLRLDTKEKERVSSRAVTNAEWVALGDRRRNM